MPTLHYLLIFLAIVFFACGHIFGTLAILARTSGIVKNRPYLAHSIEKIVALIGLLCLSFFVPILAYLTETIFSAENIIFLCATSQTFTFLSVFLLYLLRYKLIDYFSRLGAAYQINRHIFKASLSALKLSIGSMPIPSKPRYNLKIALVGLIANIFLASGFFVGFYFAGLHSDQRLTISQASIFINGVGTVITNLYGDSALARNLDSQDPHFSWSETLSSYLVGRMIGHAVVALISYLIFLS